MLTTTAQAKGSTFGLLVVLFSLVLVFWVFDTVYTITITALPQQEVMKPSYKSTQLTESTKSIFSDMKIIDGKLATYYLSRDSFSDTRKALDDNLLLAKPNSTDVYFSTRSYIYKVNSHKMVELVAGSDAFEEGGSAKTTRFRFIRAFHVRHIGDGVEIYIIDSSMIRKILGNGTVVTICGSYKNGFEGQLFVILKIKYGFLGDGGLAVNATLDDPSDLFVRKGEVFILDVGNKRIRKISRDGIISTIAGTGAGSLTFQGSRLAVETPIRPSAFSCSSSGIIYVKELKRVLKIDLDGMITPLLQSNDDNFTRTIRVVTLPSGLDELYFSTFTGISKLDEFGKFTTIAGTDSNQIYNSTMDGKMANQVYITDNMLDFHFFVTHQEGKVELYFCDGNLIRKVDSDGRIWTIFGSRYGTIEFFSIPSQYSSVISPIDATITEQGDIIFSDVFEKKVYTRKLKADGTMDVISGPYINFEPCINGESISVDSFMSSEQTNIAVSGNKVFSILRKPTEATRNSIDGLVMFSHNQVCSLYGTMKYLENQTALDSTLNDPRGLFVKDNTVYFADTLGSRVVKIVNGRLISIAGNGVEGYSGDGYLAINSILNRPSALSIHDNGDIYIADTLNHRIRMISAKTGIITTIAGNGIQGYSPDFSKATNTSLNQPRGVFVNSNGEVFISDSGNNRIRKVSRNGYITTIAGTGYAGSTFNTNPLLCDLNGPSTIQEYSGTLYFADTNNHVIRKFGYQDQLEIVAGQMGIGEISGSSPSSLLYYPEGFHVYDTYYALICDTANSWIKKLTFSKLEIELQDYTKPTSVFATSKYASEYYFTSNNKVYYANMYSYNGIKVIAGGVGDNNKVEYSKLSLGGIHTTKNYIYVADVSNNRIRRISIESGIITTVAGTGDFGYFGDNGLALQAKLASPQCVFVNAIEDIYICDTANQRIRRVDGKTGIIYTIAGNGVKGTDEGQASISRINSPSRIYVSSNSEVFFIQHEKASYSLSTPKLSKISKNGILTILPFDSATSVYGFSNSGDLVIIKEKSLFKLTLTCPSPSYILSNDFTSCVPVCNGISSENRTSCSSLGTCIAPDTCICKEQYNGTYCELAICAQGCLNGKCTKPNTCECEEGYFGGDCSNHNRVWIISISVIIGFFSCLMIALILTTVSCILYRRYRREQIILKTDTSLSSKLLTGFETELDAHSVQSTSYSTFFIPLEQLNLNKPIKRLGGGAFGFVLQCSWNSTIVAVKVFDLNNMNISEEDFNLEAAVLSSLRHPNIINFYGVSFSPTKRYIVMECLEQSLEKVLSNLQSGIIKLSLADKVRMLLEITKGINYLHTLENKIIHRDLKPANILLDKNGICKLCDFGLSRALSKNTFSALTNHVGTMEYWAPETQADDGIVRSEATAIDVFSFAIVMYQLIMEMKDAYVYVDEKVLKKLGHTSPKTFNNLYHLNRQIVENEHRPTIPFTDLEECNGWCKDYLTEEINNYDILFELLQLNKQCWAGNPNQRPTITTVIEKLTTMEKELSNRK